MLKLYRIEGRNSIDKNYKSNINDLDLGWLSSAIHIWNNYFYCRNWTHAIWRKQKPSTQPSTHKHRFRKQTTWIYVKTNKCAICVECLFHEIRVETHIVLQTVFICRLILLNIARFLPKHQLKFRDELVHLLTLKSFFRVRWLGPNFKALRFFFQSASIRSHNKFKLHCHNAPKNPRLGIFWGREEAFSCVIRISNHN